MSEKPKAKPKEDDPNQSEAFRKAVRELEAAGELNPEKASDAINVILRKNRKD
jgi:hypothetical protein